MNITIGENIKRLRREKNITQEKLSEHLNISCQAISKWERGETYPDITMVLPLAGYFGVSADELLGLDAAKNEAKIKEYLDEYYKLGTLGKTHEKFNLMCEAYKEFPNDFRIIEEYMWQLNYDPNYFDDPKKDEIHKDELYKLCSQILDECTLDKPRYSALSILSGLYQIDGNIQKAVETCKRLPDHYYRTANEEMENLYKRGSEEWQTTVRENIKELTECLMVKIRNCALWNGESPKEQIRILEKAAALINLIYDEGDFGFSNYHLCELNIWIGNRYARLGEFDTAFKHYDTALSYGKVFDELPVITKHTSFLVNRLSQDMTNTCSGFEGNEVCRELSYMETDEFYISFRDMPGFKAVIEKYKPFAKTEKHHKTL